MIRSARIVLREIFETYPEAFRSAVKPIKDGWRPVSWKLRGYLKPDAALPLAPEGYTLFTYWGTCIRVWPLARTSSSTVRTDNHLKVRFWATVGKGPEVELALL